MRYLSVCSGIEAATVAWHNLGWTPVGFSEIEPFPSAVLAHHYPNVPNFGDMTKHEHWPLQPGSIDLLVGGTPCQSFSVAGLRKGLHDPRGGLMLTYLEIARRLRPRWVVWENVPGVLSSNGGRDFGSFLGAMGLLGYGVAYRVLDAQWCRTHGHPRAVPQRRRRVFVVGCLGDWERAAQVLFECESVQRDLAPRRAQGEGSAADAQGSVGAGGWMPNNPGVVSSVCTKWSKGTGGPSGSEHFNLVTELIGFRWQNDRDGLVQDGTAPACRASSGSSGFHEMNHPVVVQPFTKSKRAQSVTDDETWVDGQVNPTLSLFDQGDTRATTVAVGFHPTQDPISSSGSIHALGTGSKGGCATAAVAFPINTLTLGGRPDAVNDKRMTMGVGENGDPQFTLQAAHCHAVAQAMTVRRLTPRECERLQGFPDDYTLIPWRKKAAADCPDGPRYKALGNSMAVNCMAWIGERIAAVENHNAN